MSNSLITFVLSAIFLLAGCASSNKKPLDEMDNESLYRMAKQAQQSGFSETARQLYEKNLKQYNHQNSRFALFWLYRDMGKKQQASKLLHTDKWKDKTQKNCALAIEEMDKQHWENAYSQLNQLNLDAPELRRCELAKAVLLDKMHAHSQAQAIYLKLLQEKPDQFSARYNLALSFLADKQADKVPELFKQQCASPSQAGCTSSIKQLMALSYGLQNKPKLARRWLSSNLNEEQIQQQLALYKSLRDKQ